MVGFGVLVGTEGFVVGTFVGVAIDGIGVLIGTITGGGNTGSVFILW